MESKIKGSVDQVWGPEYKVFFMLRSIIDEGKIELKESMTRKAGGEKAEKRLKTLS